MDRHLATASFNGSFDFFSNMVTLERYQIEQKSLIDLSVSNKHFTTENFEDTKEIRALITHEITHFLDTTTTLWGIEYIVRKMRFAEDMYLGRDLENSLSVFMLNTAELQMHKELVEIGECKNLNECNSMKHILIYNKEYGPLIMIYYIKDIEVCHRVPLSMLSVLEASAFANELLTKINLIEKCHDLVFQKIELSLVEKELTDLLDEPEKSEYTVIIKLVRMHFAELSLKELLVFVACLTKFSLDASAIYMAEISNAIKPTFADRYLGNSICMDMCRGASRHVLAFKTILLMYEWMQSINTEVQESHLQLLKSNPLKAIDFFWRSYSRCKSDFLSDIEFDMGLEMLKNFHSLLDSEIVLSSSVSNREILKNNHPGLLELDDLILMDILLADNTVIAMPNRLDIDILKYINETHFDLFYKLDKSYKDNKAQKFHMPPDVLRIDLM